MFFDPQSLKTKTFIRLPKVVADTQAAAPPKMSKKSVEIFPKTSAGMRFLNQHFTRKMKSR